MKSRKFRPYVRRANGRERASGIRDSMRLAFYQLLNKPFYVGSARGSESCRPGLSPFP